jgi:integrase
MNKQQQHTNWKVELIGLVETHGGQAALKKKQVSSATTMARKKRLISAFTTLRRAGYKIENPRNLTEKHVQVIVDKMIERCDSASTIQNIVSTLRVFAMWIGKPNMIKELAEYAPDIQRTYAAEKDKSWRGNDIDVGGLVQQIAAKDRYVGMQLTAAWAFGLRQREAIMLKPIKDIREGGLYVISGTKGGRTRMVPVETQFQKAVLAELQSFAASNHGKLIAPGLRVDQAQRRFNYMMECFGLTKAGLGVTGHGLRHQFAIESLERKGYTAPVVALAGGNTLAGSNVLAHGDSGDNGTHTPQCATLEQARLHVSEELGHSRTNITTAYYGKFSNGSGKESVC